MQRALIFVINIACFIHMAGPASAQQRTDSVLEKLIRGHASPFLLRVLDHPDSFRYQIIYTRIDRDLTNKPHFRNYYYRFDPNLYFNPASTVKMPLAFLALEKVHSLGHGVDKYSPMLTDSAYSGQHPVLADSSAADGLPSLAQYIKKIFLVSDNDAYNRLYEFLGQEHINRRLHAMGYPDIRITRRFVPMTEDENRHTNPIRFYSSPVSDSHRAGRKSAGRSAGMLQSDSLQTVTLQPILSARGVSPAIRPAGFFPQSAAQLAPSSGRSASPTGPPAYTQPAAVSVFPFDFSRPVFIGQAYYDRYDSLIHAPMDFTRHNNISLKDLQQQLQSVLFPASFPAARRFRLQESDYSFLYRYMSQYPSEEAHPQYDTTEYFDSYAKFFFFRAGRRSIPSYIRVFNKPGWSYGFLTDVAYIVDFRHHIEYMLSATIYVNRDGVLNDDKYEYDEIGFPFFKELGEIVNEYELQRPRAHIPDLARFRISYDKTGF